jgi:hypothetical protein
VPAPFHRRWHCQVAVCHRWIPIAECWQVSTYALPCLDFASKGSPRHTFLNARITLLLHTAIGDVTKDLRQVNS